MVNATPRLLYPQGRTPLPTVPETGWASAGLGCYGKEKISWSPPAFEPAASRYIEGAVLAPNKRQLAPP